MDVTSDISTTQGFLKNSSLKFIDSNNSFLIIIAIFGKIQEFPHVEIVKFLPDT